MRRHSEQLEIPLAGAAHRIECGFEHAARFRRRPGNLEGHRLHRRRIRSVVPPGGRIAEVDGSNGERLAQRFLEGAAQERRIASVGHASRECRQQLAESSSPIALPWC